MFAFSIFPILFFLVFGLVFTVFVVTFVRGISTWNRNNKSPVLTVTATVVARRGDLRNHHHSTGTTGHHSSTTYYITFQVESGDRIELMIPDQEYGYIVDGDVGSLTFQGSRFLKFARTLG